MARTVFVNPTYRRTKRKGNPRKRRRRNAMLPAAANPRRRHRRRRHRRNAGIAPFVSNPLIMSNPRRHRRRRANPLNMFTVKNVVSKGLTLGGGAAIAVTANVVAFNRIDDFWWRNGVRFGSAIGAAAFLKGDLGSATGGALLFPMFQEIAARFLGITSTPAMTSSTEADLDALAADLEDVMDELDESDLEDDDDDLEDEDDILD